MLEDFGKYLLREQVMVGDIETQAIRHPMNEGVRCWVVDHAACQGNQARMWLRDRFNVLPKL